MKDAGSRPFLVAGLLSCLVAAGCGSGNGKAAESSAAQTSVSFSGPSVKVGAITSLTGPIAYPDRVSAARAAVAGINSRGGLAGHEVELDTCDDHGNADGAAACARQMVSDGVIALVGQNSVSDNASTPILEAAGIPQIATATRTPVSLNSKLTYEPGPSNQQGYAFLAAYGAKKLGGDVALVAFDVPQTSGFRDVVTTALRPGKVTFSNTVLVPTSQADYAPVVASANREHPHSILFGLPLASLTQFIKTDASTGSKTTYLSPIQYAPSDAAALGGTAQLDRVVTFTSYPPTLRDTTNPVLKRYITELKAQEKTGDSDAALDKQTLGIQPWFGFYVLEEVVKQTKLDDISSAGLITALDSAKDIDLGDLVPTWTPTAPGITGFSRISNTSYFLVGYKNGKPYQITPEAVSLEAALKGKF